MNDADLGENINEEAQVVESCASCKKRFQNDDTHLDPR